MSSSELTASLALRAPFRQLAALRAMTLADTIGYDLHTVAPRISKRYADVTAEGDKPSLVEIALGDAQRSAGLAPADAARGVRATANCFLSWHMAAPLLELVAAQRAQEEKDGAPIFVWNNLFMIRPVPGMRRQMVETGRLGWEKGALVRVV